MAHGEAKRREEERAMTETRPDDVAATKGILENLYGGLDRSGEGARA
jgi:hypothetical protein